MRARVLLRQRDAALGKVEHRARRDVVEVQEAGLGRQGAAPRGIHREARVDVTATVHRHQAGRQRFGCRAEIGRLDPPTDHAVGEHVETGCHPGDHKAARALTQPDDGGVI